jgi:hypothetical protein
MLNSVPPLVEQAWYSAGRRNGFEGGRGNHKRMIRSRLLLNGILGTSTHAAVFAMQQYYGGPQISGTVPLVHLQAWGPTYQVGAEAYGGLNRPANLPVYDGVKVTKRAYGLVNWPNSYKGNKGISPDECTDVQHERENV